MVVSGGPGGGKTALLEVVRAHFCAHVVVLPEAGTIVFGGGFPRLDSESARRGAQVAIFHVQDQLERVEHEERRAAIVLCDRGVVDGAAYWPGARDAYWERIGEAPERALDRYAAVIHMRTPDTQRGYDRSNPVRTESAMEAARIDHSILALWDAHPRRTIIESSESFIVKLRGALDAIDECMPPCCRSHSKELSDEPRRHGAFVPPSDTPSPLSRSRWRCWPCPRAQRVRLPDPLTLDHALHMAQMHRREVEWAEFF